MNADMLNFIAVSSYTLYGVRGCCTPKDANRKMLMICFDIEHLTGKEAIELVRLHQKQ